MEINSFVIKICVYIFAVAANLQACTGRRRKRNLAFIENLEKQSSLLDGSLEEGVSLGKDDREEVKNGRILFTVWSNSATTITQTVFTTNRSITVSVSAYCTAPNSALNAC